VLAGGVVAAVAGPELARWSKDWFQPVLFAGSFLSITFLQITALVLLQFLQIPRPSVAERAAGGRAMLEIARDPKFVVAVMAGMIAYASMNFVMTATPLAMMACGLSFDATKLTMQAHVLGMFVPSFFTGHLIKRFGVVEVMLAGAVLLLACIGVNAMGISAMHFNVALTLLGVGWNFLYVGASTLLTEVPLPAERNKVQAANDFMVFGLVAISAYTSGAVHEWMGWQSANLIIPPLVIAAVGAMLWLRIRQKAPAIA
jgi:MFS family permease